MPNTKASASRSLLGLSLAAGVGFLPQALHAAQTARLLEARPGEVLRLEVHRSGQTREVLIPLDKMRMQL